MKGVPLYCGGFHKALKESPSLLRMDRSEMSKTDVDSTSEQGTEKLEQCISAPSQVMFFTEKYLAGNKGDDNIPNESERFLFST